MKNTLATASIPRTICSSNVPASLAPDPGVEPLSTLRATILKDARKAAKAYVVAYTSPVRGE